MPDSALRGAKKTLSLKRRKGDENTNPKHQPGGESKPERVESQQDSGNIDRDCVQKKLVLGEIRPEKRPLKNTYENTLEAAKRLKFANTTLEVVEKKTVALELQVELRVEPRKRNGAPAGRDSASDMLNGHGAEPPQYGGAGKKPLTVATLSNLGNTCFLNSVLYTLRFAPRFLHNLHHLAWDLAAAEQRLHGARLKSSSLGRAGAGLAAAGARSWSSKDLLSLGAADSAGSESKIQVATERLHETYVNLRAAEMRCGVNGAAEPSPEPYAADSFLSALREVNSTFEGNRQQDAHELLVCILDNIRETCQALRARAARLQRQENGDSNGIGKHTAIDVESKSTLSSLRKSWKKKSAAKAGARDSPTEERAPTPPAEEDARMRPGWDFVAEDFEGVTVLRTTCLECETVTERKQAMCDICVPVPEEEDAVEDAGEPFRAAALSSECLRDQNKYWCERCLRYNEARRSVTYESLPRLLVLQLKRFSGGMEKITRHAPTPLELSCFCEACARPARDARAHTYRLWAVIMHLGQTLSGGHYIAYVRAGGGGEARCAREAPAEPPAGGFIRSMFGRARPAGCNARDCCATRSQGDAPWLACDDDLVRAVSLDEFADLLSAEPRVRSAATPYLLFYAKAEVG